MADLIAHLHRGMAEPFRRPDCDCAMWVADWIEAATGTDPAAAMRGAYTNAAGALRIQRAWGGYLTMWKVCMSLAGFNETRTPVEGDVGVVRDAAGQIVSAIRVHGGWAAKTKGGIVIEDFAVLCAWSLRRG